MNSYVTFGTAIHLGNRAANFKEKLLEGVDDYFFIFGRKAVVISNFLRDKNDIATVSQKQPSNWILAALKIISYLTVVVPFCLLIGKAIMRSQYKFRFISPKSQNNSEENKPQNSSDFIKTIPIDLTKQIATLKEHEEKITKEIFQSQIKEGVSQTKNNFVAVQPDRSIALPDPANDPPPIPQITTLKEHEEKIAKATSQPHINEAISAPNNNILALQSDQPIALPEPAKDHVKREEIRTSEPEAKQSGINDAGITEEFQIDATGKKNCKRIFPDGTIEFSEDQRENGFKRGYRLTKNGEYTFFGAIDRFPKFSSSSGLYLAKIKLEDKTQWFCLENESRKTKNQNCYSDNYYITTEYSFDELVIYLLLNKENLKLADILKDPGHPIDLKKLLDLLRKSPENFFKIYDYNLFTILEIIEKEGIFIEFEKIISPTTGNNLFVHAVQSVYVTDNDSKNAKKNEDGINVVEQLLKFQPNLASTCDASGKSTLEIAIEDGKPETAKLLLNILKEKQITLTVNQQWAVKALHDDASFDLNTFNALDEVVKKQIYRSTNINGSRAVAAKLFPHIKMLAATVLPRSSNILAEHMNADVAHETIEKFLVWLRKSNRLFTTEEFEGYAKKNNLKFIHKGGLDRILGADYIQATAAKLGLQYVKIPIKFAVIDEGRNQISISAKKLYKDLQLTSPHLTVYAERVERVERYLSRDEMIELVKVMRAVDFGDIHDFNFIIGKDGVYAIDTEYKSFYGLNWGKMARLADMVAPQDRDWYLDLIKALEKEDEELDKTLNETWKKDSALRQLHNEFCALNARVKPFWFDLPNILA